jgi:hypothetical protein
MKFVEPLQLLRGSFACCGSVDGSVYSVDVVNTLAVSASRFTSSGVVSRTPTAVAPEPLQTQLAIC